MSFIVAVETRAVELAKFIVFLRLSDKNIRISDTELAYCISEYLDVDFNIANKAVNIALGIK